MAATAAPAISACGVPCLSGCSELARGVSAVDQHSAVHRAIVVVDVEKFGDRSRTNAHQLAVRAGLYESVEQAFTEAGITWQSCTWEDRGDGILILVPPDAPKSRLVDHLPGRLIAALHRHNARS